MVYTAIPMKTVWQHISMACLIGWSGPIGADTWLRGSGALPIDVDVIDDYVILPTPQVASMPDVVDLSPAFPVPSAQGDQGSCAAWASTYSLMTFLQYGHRAVSMSNEQVLFSPAFAYNQPVRRGCSEGMSLYEALVRLREIGAVPLSEQPYDSMICEPISDSANQALSILAQPHRIESFGWVDTEHGDVAETLRSFLANGQPLLVGMETDEAFLNHTGSQPFRAGLKRQRTPSIHENHALVLVGYDRKQSLFRLLNSWGTDWGDQGYAWMTEDALLQRIGMTYAVQPKTADSGSEAPHPPNMGTPSHSLPVSSETIEVTLQSAWHDSISLHASCTNVLADAQPQASIDYDGSGSHALHLSLEADSATHLIAQGPDGRWLCDGDALDGRPWVVFPAAASGSYTVWTAGTQPSNTTPLTLRIGTTPPPSATPIDRARTRVLEFAHELDNGDRYQGQWLDFQPHGMGLAQMANGNQYQGMWANGLPHGDGHMVLANGDQYQGTWVHGDMEGNVRVALASGDQYQGEWANNEPHGTGLYVSADGFSYEGQWVAGQRHGQGQYVEVNGDWYEGPWLDNEPAGVGQQRVTIGGDVYTGATLDGKRHGQGQYVYANGNWYKGDWVQGQRTGQGTLQLANGDWYQGDWLEGKRHGQGRYQFASGSWYEGGWKQGKKSGRGRYHFAQTGETIEGTWVKGKQVK